MSTATGIAGRIANTFINSKLTPLLMAAFLLIGLYSAWMTPREEEPQINVPIADIFVRYPGASPAEVERRIAEPMDRIVSNIDGVEYVYSTSMPGQAIIIVRFFVGDNVERSLVKLYDEIGGHMDQMPPGVSLPLIKSRSIDDVPMLTLTLWSQTHDDFYLRRLGEELSVELKKIKDIAEIKLVGGRSRQVNVVLDPGKMTAYGVDPVSISQAIRGSNGQNVSGEFSSGDQSYLVETGHFLTSSEDVANLVIGVSGDRPIYLHSVATVSDGPEEPIQYVGFGAGAAFVDDPDDAGADSGLPEDGGQAAENTHGPSGVASAITLSIAKRTGTDAMLLADQIARKVDLLDQSLLPDGVHVTTTRNYGETASHKVFELLLHLLGSVLAVTVVVWLAMGWRGGLVVFLSVPVTFVINPLCLLPVRVYTQPDSPFLSLVFVTGIVVDDSIIIAENMHRHFKMRRLPFFQAALFSINEVGNPTILATFTVVAAVLPMAFVSGLMGPYMSPMPVGATLAMLFSLLVALTITPWLAFRMFSNEREAPADDEPVYQIENTPVYRMYAATIRPLLESKTRRWVFISSVVVLLLASTFAFCLQGGGGQDRSPSTTRTNSRSLSTCRRERRSNGPPQSRENSPTLSPGSPR